MRRFKILFSYLFIGFFILSCEDQMEKNPKYERPKSLQGKVYDVIKSTPELSVFAECIEKAGLKNLINSSGLYTVMAPTNDAFKSYFSENPKYKTISDIDSVELKRLVEFHIVLMPYSKKQLRLLNTSGWINEESAKPEYSGYKRETLYRPGNRKLQVTEREGKQPLIESKGKSERIIYSASNKYAPLFYQEYMNYSFLKSSDYDYYFSRPFESKEIYFGNAKLLETETDLNNDGRFDDAFPAENGYVYLIDRVVEPMQNAYEFLWDNSSASNKQYSGFGELINEFSQFIYNNTATLSQEGALEGLTVSQLYNLTYPTLSFNLLDEATYSIPKNSIAYHNALFAPDNEAFYSFISKVIKGQGRYSDLSEVPYMIKRIIVKNHMARWTPFYPSLGGLNGSFKTDNGNRIDLTGINELEINYGSNATLVGLNKVILPREFLSVAAPVVLSKEYSYFMWSLYFTDALQILSNSSMKYTFFPIPDDQFEKDSTLRLTVNDNPLQEPAYFPGTARIFDFGSKTNVSLSVRSGTNLSLRNLVYGQIGIGVRMKNCRKEFLRNLNNYYVVINNETNLVTGGLASIRGYNGNSIIYQYLGEELVEDFGAEYGHAPDNGKTYRVDSWFQFPNSSFTDASLNIGDNRLFIDLLKKVKLMDSSGKFSFLNEGESMTVFVPTDAALKAINADKLSDEKLKKMLLSHFIVGATIFTDHVNRNPGSLSYFTKSGQRLSIQTTSPDEIAVLKPDKSVYSKIIEDGNKTNQMYLGWDNGIETDGNPFAAKSKAGISIVVHQTDNVIEPDIVF